MWDLYYLMQQMKDQLSPSGRSRVCKFVTWEKLENRWCKVNTDGAHEDYDIVAKVGRVIQNHEGCWLSGFCRNIGRCFVVEGELWGVLDGLKLVWDLGLR